MWSLSCKIVRSCNITDVAEHIICPLIRQSPCKLFSMDLKQHGIDRKHCLGCQKAWIRLEALFVEARLKSSFCL
jgi:hypothetical protein